MAASAAQHGWDLNTQQEIKGQFDTGYISGTDYLSLGPEAWHTLRRKVLQHKHCITSQNVREQKKQRLVPNNIQGLHGKAC